MPDNDTPPKKLSLIVAASRNDVIGVNDDLPWKLSADLKRFKRLTMGHSIIMGRKTYESIGRLLPGRTTVIVTRNRDYRVPGAVVVSSIEAVLEAVADDERPFVVGGSELYAATLPMANEIHLTRVQTEINGDTFLPAIDWRQWKKVLEEPHLADKKNQFDYSFEIYCKIGSHPGIDKPGFKFHNGNT